MFLSKKNRLSKKILANEISLEKGLYYLREEEPQNWKAFLELAQTFFDNQSWDKSQKVTEMTCDYFPIRPEPFEMMGKLLEKQKIGGGSYFILAQEKYQFQRITARLPTEYQETPDSLHLQSHQLLQKLIRCEDFFPLKLGQTLAQHPRLPLLLVALLTQQEEHALRRNSWPLIHSIGLLRQIDFKDACAPLAGLLEHPDAFVLEEAKTALYWILTEHPDQLQWLIRFFQQQEHSPRKLQLLDLLSSFGEQEDCYNFLSQLLQQFRRTSDAKYSTQYAYLIIQRLLIQSNRNFIQDARRFFEKNKSWFTDRRLEKLFEVIEQMEGTA